MHNTAQTACDSLPLDVEATVVKLYQFFYQYTVRVTNLKHFCEFAEEEFKRLLSHWIFKSYASFGENTESVSSFKIVF